MTNKNEIFNKTNCKEWFDRYKYAELLAICAALASSQFSLIFNGLTTAYLITVAEYFAFYSVIVFISYQKLSEKKRRLNRTPTFKEFFYLIKNLVLEFGYPALLDFFIIRPFFMYWMPVMTGHHFIGIILGKISADCIFYFLAIVNYEWLKKVK